MSYNGWTNYETWAVALWIDNEEPSYRQRVDMASEAVEEHEGNKEEAATLLSRQLKDWLEEMQPDLGGTLWGDLLNAAMSEVNWYEIAESWVEEVEYEPIGA